MARASSSMSINNNEEVLARTFTHLNENVEGTIIRQNWAQFRSFVKLKRTNFIEKVKSLQKIARVHTGMANDFFIALTTWPQLAYLKI